MRPLKAKHTRNGRRLHYRIGANGLRRALLLCLALQLGCADAPGDASTGAGGPATHEARALWITRFDWRTPGELRALIDSAAAAHINLVFLQVPAHPGALYGLRMQRWNTRYSALTGFDAGWDPLQEALRSAHARSLQLHVWLNTFSDWPARPLVASAATETVLPDPFWWLNTQRDGQNGWQSPAGSGARTRTAHFAAQLARLYPIDGVHLDFARYPSAAPDSLSLQMWQRSNLAGRTSTFDAFRRTQVSAAVRAVRDSLRAARPQAVLSAAVWGIYRNSNNWAGVSAGYDDLFQDARAWAADGIVDVVVPMIYWPIAQSYGARTDFAWLADEHVRGNTSRHTWVGITLEHMMRTGQFNKAELLAEIERARRAQAQGVAILSAARLRQQRLWSVLGEGPFREPASLPAMPWRDLESRTEHSSSNGGYERK